MTIQKSILFLSTIITLFFSCDFSNSETTQTASSSHNIESSRSNAEVAIPSTQTPASNKIHPVDEGQLRPDFQRFREELMAALDRKDVSFIKQVIDDNIQIGYGGENGKAAFIEKFGLKDNPGNSELWKELRKILQMGGIFDRKLKNGFMAPYVSATWPEGVDPLEYLAITEEKVEVYAKPDWNAKTVTTLNYDFVRRLSLSPEKEIGELDGENWPWVHIEMADKTRGYVFGKYVHGAVDYRAYFKQKGVKWKLMSFVQGD